MIWQKRVVVAILWQIPIAHLQASLNIHKIIIIYTFNDSSKGHREQEHVPENISLSDADIIHYLGIP